MPTVGCDELGVEYNKLGAYATSLPHVFLHVTDELAPAVGARAKHRCVIARDKHEQLLGRLCAFLRSSALSPSDIDSRTSAVGAAGGALV